MESIQEKLFPSNRFRLVALSPDAKEERITVQLIRGHYTSKHSVIRFAAADALLFMIHLCSLRKVNRVAQRSVSDQTRPRGGVSAFFAVNGQPLRSRAGLVSNAGGLKNLAPARQAVAGILHARPQEAPALSKRFASGTSPLPRESAQTQGNRLRERRSRVPQKTLRPPVPPCLARGTGRRRRLPRTRRVGLRLGRLACLGDCA